jgi:hypothetical protein
VDLNGYFRTANKKILLLLDNAPSHKYNETLSLEHVEVRFFPPNSTSHLQPMDAGIIASLKAKYRQRLIRHHLEEVERGADSVKKVNLKQATDMLVSSWDTVTSQTIANCWRATGIIPNVEPTGAQADVVDDEKEETAKTAQLIDELQLFIPNPMTASEYLDIDNQIETEREMTDDEIVQIVKGGSTDETESDDEPILEVPVWSSSRVFDALENIVRYIEQEGEEAEEDYKMCSRLLQSLKVRVDKKKKQTSILDFYQ